MHAIGFSTGAVARGDFHTALRLLADVTADAVELSALRLAELGPLVQDACTLQLGKYKYVSFHAPAKFTAKEEPLVVDALRDIAAKGWFIIVHPDAVIQRSHWRPIQKSLCFENMDKRKPIGRTAEELALVFDYFEESSLCFDIGHAHQIDPTMSEARMIAQRFASRIRQLHVSEVNTNSQHVAVSAAAKYAFRKVLDLISDDVPLIIESIVDGQELQGEIDCVSAIFRQRVHALFETD